jgi:hypothetical protein
MNQGLAILMERIDTNPEEFIGRSSTVAHMSRWGTLVDIALDPKRSDTFITPEEREALAAKLAVVRGDYFHKEVLRKLMEDQTGDDSSDQRSGGKKVTFQQLTALNAKLGNASSNI